MSRKVTVQKTAIFKLHNPSGVKRQALNLAFARYGEAYNLLLEKCKAVADSWLTTALSGERLPSLHRAMKQIYPLCPGAAEMGLPSALRDGIIADVAGNLLSYCELRRAWEGEQQEEKDENEPRYPAPNYGFQPETYFETLAEAASWVSDPFDFRHFQARLTREAKEMVRPLFFCRLRDFRLEHLENDRWGIAVNLQPKGRRHGRLRFPLAFGKWHEESYLDKGTPRCAHLCRRDGEYFLHVSFEFETEVMLIGEEKAYLGIDRGIIKQAAYALIDLKGRVISTGILGKEQRRLQIALGKRRQSAQSAGRRMTAKDWQGRHQEEILHQVANALIELAVSHKALVVMEDLNLHNAGRFVRSQYAKLAKILDYKLQLAGLGPPKEVFSAWSSKLCSCCGEMGKREGEDFCCSQCGMQGDADENAAVNIARRALYRKSKWENKGGYQAFHRSFGALR
jgi:IS605 OrfB family transposase